MGRNESAAREREPLLPSQAAHTSINHTTSRLNGKAHINGNGHASHRDDADDEDDDQGEEVCFTEDDSANPRNWRRPWKWGQTAQICIIAFTCPMASSMFAPAISEIADEFGASTQTTLLGQTSFVVMLGVGPLLLAPMSEMFGRRIIFLVCLAAFAVLQVPTALSVNVEMFVAFRLLAGFFGSVGVANGGGTISDMFETHKRAQVLGLYLMAPLLGPSIGPLIGAVVVANMSWRWIFWISFILSSTTTILCYFCLCETRAVTILEQRKAELEKKHEDAKFYVEGSGDSSLMPKIAKNSTRAVKILTTQPIVLILSLYQALVFSTMYTIYASYSGIWTSPPYNFTSTQLGLAYLGPALGFVFLSVFIVGYIDKVYVWFSDRNNDDGQPEYRLPMATVGAVLLPTSLFWFGWAVEKGLAWPVALAATFLFGASQVSIFNNVQTYYIDAYESNAASALAAGAFLRSVVGGIVPLFVSGLFDKLGYGWGMSVFGFISLALMPAPLVFYWVGRRLRERFPYKG